MAAAAARVDRFGNAQRVRDTTGNERGDASAPQHLSRWRRRASSRPWRRSCPTSATSHGHARSISRRWRTAASSCRAATCTTEHRQNLILPGRSTHMGDGWETKRRRGPGHDWTIVRLARRASIERVELDTDHYKGNAPGACMLECCDIGAARTRWHSTPNRRNGRRSCRNAAAAAHAPRVRCRRSRTATHVRLNIYPDGGVARLRPVRSRDSVTVRSRSSTPFRAAACAELFARVADRRVG